MSFAAILVLATVVTGVVWAAEVWLLRPRRRRADGEMGSAWHIAVDWSRSFFPVILIVLLIRSFVAEPFRIPSASMVPTLHVGDFILVNKFAYGFRLPVAHTKIVPVGEPQRGDVVVFRFPEQPSVDFIKRIVGVPGDRIQYRDKVLYINGKRMDQQVLGHYNGPYVPDAVEALEHLDKVEHHILRVPGQGNLNFPPQANQVVVVPEGRYFVMGDNRDNSNDSRYWGFVPEQNLVGKAFFIWMSWDMFNAGPAWSRFFQTIH